jgi:hypothetical protein
LIDRAAEGVHARLGDTVGVGLPEDVGHWLPLVLFMHKVERTHDTCGSEPAREDVRALNDFIG